MRDISQNIAVKNAMSGQTINTGSLTSGNGHDIGDFSSICAALMLGGFTPSATTAISSLVQLQSSADGITFADVSGVNQTNVISNKRQTITLSTDLITGNVVDMNITLYNNKPWAYALAMPPITFGTDHATTRAAIVSQLNTTFGSILTATASGDVITLTANQAGVDFNVNSCAVTLGATQPTVVIATSNAFSGSGVMKFDINANSIANRYIRFNVTHTITGGGSALQTSMAVICYGAHNLPVA